MKKRWTGIFSALGMLVLILDTKTALMGIREGLQLCQTSVIPALFPFCVLSILLTGSLASTQSQLLAPLERLLHMPSGSGSLFLMGLVGGYPTGAQAVVQCRDSGQLTNAQAGRLLGFCSNAGPAFLFGICGGLFPQKGTVWLLWLIHITSSMAVGILLPTVPMHRSQLAPISVSLPQALQRAVKTMALVCGWILLFRMAMVFLDRWFLLLTPAWIRAFILGLLELTNGCCLLSSLPSVGLRFVLCSVFLAFGGLCVVMQTASSAQNLGMYLPGKLLQAVFSAALSSLLAVSIFEGREFPLFAAGISIILAVMAVLMIKLLKCKNKGSIPAVFGV